MRIPCLTSRDRVFPNPVENLNRPVISAIASFSALLQTLTLISACAWSVAAAWVKCTT